MDSERSHSAFSASGSDAGFDAHYARSRTESEAQGGSVLSDLAAIAAHLQFVAGIAVALDLALRQQNAERDHELADCLRFGVIDSTARELERTRKLLEQLGGTSPMAPQ